MTVAFDDTTLVVLAGGQGRRLGQGDKAFVEVGGRAMIDWVLDHSARFAATLLVSDPRPRLAALGWPVVPDVVPHAGAPGGVHAGLARARTPWVCVLACDMPEVRVEALELLWAARPGHDVVLAQAAGRLHPLHALYRVEAARHAALEVAQARGSMHDLLARLRTATVLLPPPWARSVVNVNRPEDLVAAERYLSSRDAAS